MNALKLIAAGMAAGLCICLVLRLVWANYAAHATQLPWRSSNALNELLYVGSHALIGGGIGALFWLSWGFSALSNLTWWQQGLSFGALNALVFGIFPLLILRGVWRCSAALYWLLITEVLCTSTAAALAASWSWQQVI